MKYVPLVLGNHSQGLGLVRSLGDAGYPGYIVNDKRFSLARMSKHTSRYFYAGKDVLSGIDDVEGQRIFLDFLMRGIPDENYLAFPVDDDIIHFFIRNKKKLSQRFYFPNCSYNQIIDKYAFFMLAKDSGVPVPRTFTYDEFRNTKEDEQGAYIIKGRVGHKFRTQTGHKCYTVSETVMKDLEKKNITTDDLIIQEKISGNNPIVSLCGLASEGALIGIFMYEKIKQHPAEFGTGTLLQSTFIPEVLKLGRSIIRSLRYTGIFEIEYKWSIEHNAFVPLEMNPRTWKSIQFATRCGQNFPAKYLAMVNGDKVESDLEYDKSKTWIDLATYIPQELTCGNITKLLTPFDYECVGRGDPLPFLSAFILAPLILLGI